MSLQVAVKAALPLVLVVVSQVTAAYSQNSPAVPENRLKSYRVVSPETYNRVLDEVFPRDDSGLFVIVLRFQPNFQAESQIIIRRELDKAEVIEYTSLGGNIYRQLNDVISHGGKEDAGEMAKLIKVKKRSIRVPLAQVKEWHSTFLASIGESLKTFTEKIKEDASGTSSIALDGTFYGIWYRQIGGEMSFRLYDQAVEVPRLTGDFKLVQWMTAMRRDIAQRK